MEYCGKRDEIQRCHPIFVDYMTELIPELTEKLLQILEWRTLGQCCLVSRGWNDVITNSRVWVSLCRREEFVAGPSVLSGRVTHKALFLHLKHRLDNLQNELIVRELPYKLDTASTIQPTPDTWACSMSDGLVAGGGISILLVSHLFNSDHNCEINVVYFK